MYDVSLLDAKDFIKSSYSDNQGTECVGVARPGDGYTCLRNDTFEAGTPEDIRLVFPDGDFDAFQLSVRNGTFGKDTQVCLEIIEKDADTFVYRSLITQPGETELVFTRNEHEAFMLAVRDGQFDLKS